MQLQRIVILSFLSFISSNIVFSQDTNEPGTLITDRPDQTESPNTIPKGYLQIEAGGLYESSGDDIQKQKAITYASTLLRYGLLDNLEIRVGFSFSEITTEMQGVKLDNIASGFSPLLLGIKVGVGKEKGGLPEIGLLAHVITPCTAGSDYKTETTGGNIIVAFKNTLNEKSGLGYNFGVAWGNDFPEITYKYTLVYGYSLTNTIGVYAELYGGLPENSKPNHLWDAGVTILLSDAIQLDASVGSGITEGQNLMIGAGVSIRLPH